MQTAIPIAVCAVVGDVLGGYYYNHSRINTLFLESGAPGEPPEGNCVDKCTAWLKRCNTVAGVDPLAVLGKVLEEFMETDVPWGVSGQEVAPGRTRVHDVLAKHGLSYQIGGHILGASIAASSRDLQHILQAQDLAALNQEFERALATVESDPPAALTAACSLIESLCQVYIDDESLDRPPKQAITSLWRVVADSLGFDPRELADDDLKRILGGLSSIVDGIGSLRTHAGSAHGRGRRRYRVEPRHARLAINAAHTLAVFVLETWQAHKARSS